MDPFSVRIIIIDLRDLLHLPAGSDGCCCQAAAFPYWKCAFLSIKQASMFVQFQLYGMCV